MSGFRLIAVLVIMGGLIAYAGDRIGMKIGRKRLTLLGLRPKHTSVAVAVLTGIFIASGSIGALTLASNDVRTALFHMKQIQTALSTSRTQLNALAGTVEEQRKQLREIQAMRDTAVKERDKAEADKNAIKAEYDEAKRKLDGIEQFYQTRIEQLKELQETLDARVQALQKAEADANAKLQALWNQYQALQTKMQYGEYIFQKDDIVTAGLVTGGRSETEIKEDLMALLDRADKLAHQRGARLSEKPESAVKYVDQGHFLNTLSALARDQGKWVVRVMSVANTQAGEPLVVYLWPIKDKLIYAKDQLVAETGFEPGSDAQTAVINLLFQARSDAVSKGILTQADGSVGELADSAQFLDVIGQLAKQTRPVKIRAYAVGDTWASGSLAVRLQVVR